MTTGKKTSESDPVSEKDTWEESSSVYSTRAVPRKPASGEFQIPSAEHRVNELVRLGQVLLADLPPNHPRARLLRLATVRRDEVILSGLIAEIYAEQEEALPSTIPPPRRASEPDHD